MGAALFAAPAFAAEGDAQTKAQHYLTKMDKNTDSQVSKDEHDKFGDQMFDEADTNDDDKLSLAEMTAKKQAEMDEWKSMHGSTGSTGGTTGKMDGTMTR